MQYFPLSNIFDCHDFFYSFFKERWNQTIVSEIKGSNALTVFIAQLYLFPFWTEKFSSV